ncbi:hypothetical protein CHS0354_007617 [Potamilus streckersoni]|uniref:CARD domain-containing protein n=1 Tax=Potamilus streckersoni TaxID=2493646 RepID=A0AAE0T4N4_9BIVA|nr:hypothetical protein CHS0354_007617 [Potamilus streckersoni]
MTMHITFNTDVEHGVDDEIVKRYKNNSPNPSLDVKLLEFHMQSAGIDKGYVDIRLLPLSWRALNKLKSVKPDDIEAIIKSLLTKKDIKKLKESALKSVDIKIVADTNLSTPKEALQDEGIRKEAIVKHFTQLSKSLPNIWELIPAFIQDDQIRDSAKPLLKLLMHLKRDARKEAFLHFLLEEESDRVHVIFKRQLKQRRMIHILKILESQGDGEKETDDDLGTDEIKKNYSFLLEELDGLQFLPAFAEKGLLGDEILEKMTGSLHRRDRTKLCIDFVLSSGDETRDLFYKELHKRQQENIYHVLWSTKYPSPGSTGKEDRQR